MRADIKNKYSEEEPQLREAWAKGFRLGLEGETVPRQRIYETERKEIALIEGYIKATFSRYDAHRK